MLPKPTPNFVFLTLIAICSPAFSLTSYHAEYAVTLGGIKVGTLTREYQQDGKAYQFTTVTHSLLPILKLNGEETSQGEWQGEHVIPRYYAYHYAHNDQTNAKRLAFDWDKKTVTDKKHDKTLPLACYTHDKLSYQLAMQQDLAKTGTKLRYKLTDGHRMQQYQFDVTGMETLSTPLGSLKTLVVERNSKNHQTKLWLAPDYEFVIVRAEYHDRGQFTVHAKLSSYQALAK